MNRSPWELRRVAGDMRWRSSDVIIKHAREQNSTFLVNFFLGMKVLNILLNKIEVENDFF